MRPGITNAVGCVVADVRHDYVNSINVPLNQADMDQVHDIFASQIRAGNEIIASEGIDIEEIVIIHQVDMQFQGQTHILNFPVQNPSVSRSALQSLFEKAYWNRFNVELPEIRAVLVNLHTSVIGRRKPVPLKTLISQTKHKKSSMTASFIVDLYGLILAGMIPQFTTESFFHQKSNSRGLQ